MQPSSLVFVAIIVGWVAYLLPQWVRRRETLGQSRGRDRHSSGLRLLSRRPRTATGPSTTPLLPDPRSVTDPVVDPLAEPAPEPDVDDGAVLPAVQVPSAAAVAARRRARVLSLLLVVTATAWALALVMPYADLLARAVTGLLVLDLGALVISGRRREVRRRMLQRERRHRAELARRDAARRACAGAAPSAPVAEEVAAPAAPVTAPVPVVERASERVARELDEGAPPAVWTPVPVPPPTYTLKETAPRPEPAPLDLPAAPPPTPAEPAASVAPASPARVWEEDRTFADELDLDAVLARRRAVNG